MYKILLVEDDMALHYVYKKMKIWSENDFCIRKIASNGKEALEMLENDEFDMVVTDIRMPVLDGIGLLKKMSEKKIDIYTIILSSYDEFEYARQAMIYGAADFIVKPLKEKELGDALVRAKKQFEGDSQKSDMLERIKQHIIADGGEIEDEIFLGRVLEYIMKYVTENKTMEAYLQELDQRIEKVKEDNEEQLLGDFWKAYRLKELYKKGKYVVDLKTKAAIYAFSSLSKDEIEGIVNIPGLTIHELPIDTYQDQGVEGPVYVENNAFFQPFECLFTFKPGEKFDPTILAGVVMMISAFVLLGDLGVGILCILLSLVARGNIGKLLQRVGVAVTIGGLLSGTVFYSMSLYDSIFVVGTNYAMKIGLFFVINIAVLLVCSLVKKVTKRLIKSKGGLSWQ